MDIGAVLNLVVTATPLIGQEVAEVSHVIAAVKEALAAKGYEAETVELEARFAEDARRAQLAHEEANAAEPDPAAEAAPPKTEG